MAEFVDNSLQSFLSHKEELEQVEGPGFKLQVSIELNTIGTGSITIRDNAAGIHEADYQRAFRPAEVPLDRSGLSEFGMGMKSAACWFARKWTVRTCAIGEGVERTVSFDIDKIVEKSVEELRVDVKSAKAETHFTEIVLTDLHRPPQSRTIGKIKEHLAGIYRMFIRQGIMVLRFDGDTLLYPEPRILTASFYRKPTEPETLWRKDINFDLGLGLSVHGFAALRETGSTSSAGFALFRRGRLIQGSADEGYRPEFIFGKSNSYTYQRLFGELELEGFDVSHTKDGFRWEENEETFLELLKEELNEEPKPLLDQAEGYRARPKRDELKASSEAAAQRTADVIKREVPPILELLQEEQPVKQDPPTVLSAVTSISYRVIDVELNGIPWHMVLELTDDPAVGDWVELSDQLVRNEPSPTDAVRLVGVRFSLAHPFTERFGGRDASQIEPLLRLAAAIALAETAARDSGVKLAGTFRRNINELLRDAFSKP